MNLSLETVVNLLVHYRYEILLPVAIFEGPIVTVAAAFLAASTGIFNVYVVYLIAVVGDLIGDSAWYWAARLGGKHFLRFAYKRLGGIGVTEHNMAKAESALHQHFYKTIVVGKITNFVMLAIILASGVLKVGYKRFILATQSMDIPKDLIFTAAGFFFGQYLTTIDTGVHRFYILYTALLAVLVLIVVSLKFVRRYVAQIYG